MTATGNRRGDGARRQDLLEAQLAALFEVSSVLSRSLDLSRTLRAVLEVLHQQGRMSKSMVSLVDQDTGELMISALYENKVAPFAAVRYRSGEGVIGTILARNRPWIVPRVADEPRFLDKLGVYDPQLPFIGVPIRVGTEGVIGVFAAQPPAVDDSCLGMPGFWRWSPRSARPRIESSRSPTAPCGF